MPHLKREWLTLGETTVDLSRIIKIAFGKDARLFAIAGDALALAAWTKERSERAALSRFASAEAGWIHVRPETLAEADYADPEEMSEPEQHEADERLCLRFIDRVVETTTKHGHVLELFSGGVYVGEVAGDQIEAAKEQLGL